MAVEIAAERGDEIVRFANIRKLAERYRMGARPGRQHSWVTSENGGPHGHRTADHHLH